MSNGIITKSQIGNISKLSYDIAKLLVGGGIITPYLSHSGKNEISISIFLVAGIFVLAGLILDYIYDSIS